MKNITEIEFSESGDTSPNFPPDNSFQAVPSLLLQDLRRDDHKGKKILQHIDIATYALLKSHSYMKGNCYPSLRRLAEEAACSVATMQRSLKRLDNAGHIQRKSHNKGKIFLLTDVNAKGEILRKNRIVFTAKPRLLPEMQPKIQDLQSATSSQATTEQTDILDEEADPF